MTEKHNWKNDVFLRTTLSDSASAPVAVGPKKFEPQYTFVVKPKSGPVYLKRFVPKWGVPIVCAILDKDSDTKSYSYCSSQEKEKK